MNSSHQTQPFGACTVPGDAWQPIETAPKDGRSMLLGHFNSHGRWRTLRGQWFSAGVIEETWEDIECPEGWYETSVECGDDVNAWWTEPTHWMPLPSPPGSQADTERARSDGKNSGDAQGSISQPEGLMFDAFGNPRVRYVRIHYDGSFLVLPPKEAESYMADIGSDGTDYTTSDVYLSEREFDDLPEFDGF